MSLKRSENIVTPVGRIVMGSVDRPRTTDQKGVPLVYKTGQNKGQPRSEYFIGFAIPKGPEVQQAHAHLNWVHTTWGAVIYKAGTEFLAHAGQLPGFAWKVADGDSAVPNKVGRRNCDTEGMPGHWILFFSGSVPPKLCDSKGVQTPEAQLPGYIKTGYYAQVGFNAVGNESTESPGVYLNPLAVSLAAYGPEIFSGVDTTQLGFGGAALPPGASVTPLANMNPAAAMPAPAVALPGPAAVALPGPALAVAQVPPPLPAATVAAMPGPAMALPSAPTLPSITPNAAFLQVATLKPTALATHTLDQYKQAGYTEEQLITAGIFVR